MASMLQQKIDEERKRFEQSQQQQQQQQQEAVQTFALPVEEEFSSFDIMPVEQEFSRFDSVPLEFDRDIAINALEQELMADAKQRDIDAMYGAIQPEEVMSSTESKENELRDVLKFDAINSVINEEQGFVNNPKDKGGATKYGIALNFQKENLKKLGIPATVEGIKNLTKEQAASVYGLLYEDSATNYLPPEVQSDYFNAYVNSPGRAVKTLQKLVGTTADGKVGPNTIKAIKNYNFPENTGALLRKNYLVDVIENTSKDNLPEFSNGWANRYLQTDVFGQNKINLNKLPRKEILKIIESWNTDNSV